MSQTCNWKGASGKNYKFNVYEKGENFNDVTCIYVYSYVNSNNKWKAVYVGQTTQLKTRISQHANSDSDTDKCIRKSNFTHIHVYQVPSNSLDSIETDLLKQYTWSCNVQGN
ncbi:MAG: GIY-YIG nuclease family protein [Brevinema sp.]